MTVPTLRLGLIGHGTVGSAFSQALRNADDLVASRLGARIQLTQVAVRSPDTHRRALPGVRVHDDPTALVHDPAIDLIVEASGHADAAAWLTSAIGRGVPAISANKLAIARDPGLLRALADRHPLLHCEAAVAAALPIVRALRESLDGEEIDEVRAVLNGTTTFILSEIEHGLSFPDALDRARVHGYTEADASADLSGLDAAAKLALLATLIWRRPITVDQVERRGIDGGITERVIAARRKGYVVRLLALAQEDDTGAVSLNVSPTLLHFDDPLARTEGVTNAVELQCGLAGPLVLYGAGAGGRHTASALLNDVLAASRTVLRPTVVRIAA